MHPRPASSPKPSETAQNCEVVKYHLQQLSDATTDCSYSVSQRKCRCCTSFRVLLVQDILIIHVFTLKLFPSCSFTLLQDPVTCPADASYFSEVCYESQTRLALPDHPHFSLGRPCLLESAYPRWRIGMLLSHRYLLPCDSDSHFKEFL